MLTLARAWILVALVGLCVSGPSAGCEKTGASSGPLPAEQVALLRDIPSRNIAIGGRKFVKLQQLLQSQMMKLIDKLGEKSGVNFNKWMTCYADVDKTESALGIGMRGGAIEFRAVFTGITLEHIAECGKQAGLDVTIDPDGKFASLIMPLVGGQRVPQGYLKLADGALYIRQRWELGGGLRIAPTSRSDLEADQTLVASGTAADDKDLLAIAGKADRNKMLWFAANGTSVPMLKGKLGEIYGTMDFTPGIAMEITAQINDTKLADQIVDAVSAAKKQTAGVPEQLRAIIDSLEVSRDGEHIHFGIKISDDQLGALSALAGR